MGQGRLYLQSQKGCQGLASLGSVLTTGAVMVTRYFVLIFDKKKKRIFLLSQAWWYIPVVLVCVGMGGWRWAEAG